MNSPFIWVVLSLVAQSFFAVLHSHAAEPNATRQFRVLTYGDPTSLQGLLYELGSEEVMIYPSDVSLSPLYESPKGGQLKLYRKLPAVPPETEPRKEVVFSVDLGSEALSLLVLKSESLPSGGVSGMVVNDTWEAFPAKHVRVLNLSKRKSAAQIEGVNAEIAPGGSKLFTFASTKPRIRIKVASYDDGQWKLRFSNSQAIIPEARINVIVSDFEPTPEDPNPDGVSVIKMIDPIMAPKS